MKPKWERFENYLVNVGSELLNHISVLQRIIINFGRKTSKLYVWCWLLGNSRESEFVRGENTNWGSC
jgi:hypothetical protein